MFDFKFIILLGLTLVVYLMYKEIDFQRERISQCENQIKTLLETNPTQFHNEINQLVQSETKSRPALQHPEKKDQLLKPQNKPIKVPPKNLNLNLPNKMIASESKVEIPKVSKTVVVVVSESTEKESEKNVETENKHLEIYSNDNDILIETTVSDTLVKNNKNNSETSSEKTSSEDENDDDEDDDEDDDDDDDNDDDEKAKNENDDEENNSIVKENNNEDKVESENVKVKEDSPKKTSKSSTEELDEILKDLKIEITDGMIKNKTPRFELPSLLKMKLPELQNLALKENISLEKNVKGISKKKNKQELAEEILEKKISN